MQNRASALAVIFADLEGWRTELRVQYAFGRGVVATLDAPWLDTTSPHWDAVAEQFHVPAGGGERGRS